MEQQKYKIMAIMGQSGSGKDSFVDAIIKNNLIINSQKIIKITTRPIRQNEVNGKSYYFVDTDVFATELLTGDLIEATEFKGWHYGTSIKTLDINKINIGVFDPDGVEILKENDNIDLFLVYITASDKVRLLRQLHRENNPDCDEIVRRFGTDKKDFSASRITRLNPDCVIKNNGDQDIDEIAKEFVKKYYMLGKNH